jgi:hypothetical protein
LRSIREQSVRARVHSAMSEMSNIISFSKRIDQLRRKNSIVVVKFVLSQIKRERDTHSTEKRVGILYINIFIVSTGVQTKVCDGM